MPLNEAALDRLINKPTWLGSQRNPTQEQIDQARANGRAQEKRAGRRFAKWAKSHPEEAARILAEQAAFAAATEAERQGILDDNNDSIGHRPAVTEASGFDGRAIPKQAA